MCRHQDTPTPDRPTELDTPRCQYHLVNR